MDATSTLLAIHFPKLLVGRDPSVRSFRLFDLAQEIQDMISDHAYPFEPALYVVRTNRWSAEEVFKTQRIGATDITRTSQPWKVDEWLISKRFFLAAASAWFSAQTFSSPSRSWIYERETLGRDFLLDFNGLFCTFATHVEVEISPDRTNFTVPRLLFCQNLKSISLLVAEDVLDLGKRYGWTDKVTDEELMEVLRTTGFDGLRGIKTLTMKSQLFRWGNTDKGWFISTSEQRPIFEDNLRRLEALLAESARQPRDGSSVARLGDHFLGRLLDSYLNPSGLGLCQGTWGPLYLCSVVWSLSNEQVESLRMEHEQKVAQEDESKPLQEHKQTLTQQHAQRLAQQQTQDNANSISQQTASRDKQAVVKSAQSRVVQVHTLKQPIAVREEHTTAMTGMMAKKRSTRERASKQPAAVQKKASALKTASAYRKAKLLVGPWRFVIAYLALVAVGVLIGCVWEQLFL